MIEVLPIRLLTDEDGVIFGAPAVVLGKLSRLDFPVSSGIVVAPPHFKLLSILEKRNFGIKELFEQNLTFLKKEIFSIPIPESLMIEIRGHDKFLVDGILIKSAKNLWLKLLENWVEEIKLRLWDRGFYPGVAVGLDPKVVVFNKNIINQGFAFHNPILGEVVVNTTMGKLQPADEKKIADLVLNANKKLLLPYEYEWVFDHGIKLVNVRQYPYLFGVDYPKGYKTVFENPLKNNKTKIQTAIKIFLELSEGKLEVNGLDGIYIASENFFNLEHPKESLEDLILRVVDASNAYPANPILLKLADLSEDSPLGSHENGRVRGALRLLHQDSLRNPLLEALLFIRHKKGLSNVHIIIPFVRTVHEFLQLKRELAAKKLSRKNSLQIWMEVSVPENMLNLENYLEAGLDGMILNLDELQGHLNGFDINHEELIAYRSEEKALIKFMENGLGLMKKNDIPFVSFGKLSLNPHILEYLAGKGLSGVIAHALEFDSTKDLLQRVEKSLINRKSI